MTTAAQIALEQLEGKRFKEVVLEAALGSVKHFRSFFWASFQDKHPDVTVVRAGELIDEIGGVEKLAEVLVELTGQAKPDPRDLEALGGGVPLA